MVLLHNIKLYNYCVYTLNPLILCLVLCNCKCLLIDHIAGSLQRDQLYLRTLEEHISGNVSPCNDVVSLNTLLSNIMAFVIRSFLDV